MTQVTGQWAHPRTRSPQSFNRYITDSMKAIEPWLEVPSAKPCADPGIFARGRGVFSPQHCDFPGGPDPLFIPTLDPHMKAKTLNEH